MLYFFFFFDEVSNLCIWAFADDYDNGNMPQHKHGIYLPYCIFNNLCRTLSAFTWLASVFRFSRCEAINFLITDQITANFRQHNDFMCIESECEQSKSFKIVDYTFCYGYFYVLYHTSRSIAHVQSLNSCFC